MPVLAGVWVSLNAWVHSKGNMQTPRVSSFLIATPSVGWYVLVPVVVVGLAELLPRYTLSVQITASLLSVVLAVVPARLVVSSSGLQIAWLGRRWDILWREVATVRSSRLWGGVWIVQRSGRQLPLFIYLRTRKRVAELRDAIREYVQFGDTKP